MISATFDFSKINAKLDKITQAAKEAVRPAAQAGAQVFYEEVLQRVPVGTQEHSTKGKKFTFQPGNLRAAIYQAFADDESGKGRAIYRVSWNKKKAPHGHLVENGTSRMPAHPFIRPAFDHVNEAIRQGKEAMAEKMNGIGE